MLPELLNIKTKYPFQETQEVTSDQLSFMQCIRQLCLWLHTNKNIQASVIYFSPQYFTVYVTDASNSISQQIKVYSNGNIQGSDFVDVANSYVQYSNPVAVSASCNLKLLPQVLHTIPYSLRIHICTNQVQAKAVQNDTATQSVLWTSQNMIFVHGYNFQPSISNDSLVLTAGAGLGDGSPTAFQVRQLLQGGNAKPAAYYNGVININGQTGEISFESSASIYMKIETEQSDSNVFQIISLSLREGENDTSN